MNTFYCKYCGSKIMLDDTDRLNAKIKEMEHEYGMEKLKMEREKQERRWIFPTIVTGCSSCFYSIDNDIYTKLCINLGRFKFQCVIPIGLFTMRG